MYNGKRCIGGEEVPWHWARRTTNLSALADFEFFVGLLHGTEVQAEGSTATPPPKNTHLSRSPIGLNQTNEIPSKHEVMLYLRHAEAERRGSSNDAGIQISDEKTKATRTRELHWIVIADTRIYVKKSTRPTKEGITLG